MQLGEHLLVSFYMGYSGEFSVLFLISTTGSITVGDDISLQAVELDE